MPNIWTTDDYVYQSTVSGVNVYDNETEEMLWLVGYAAGVNSVWADSTYLYIGTTNSGIYRCSVSTISGVQDTHQYLSEPDITNNLINYVHGADKYICVSTVSGVDHINMNTTARSYTDLDYGSSKCHQTSTGRFYYLQNDYMPSGWAYRRKIKLSQPTIKNDIIYVELNYGANIFPKGNSLLHSGSAYPHYANNNGGSPSNMSDGDLETYCQGMTYLAVDFGAENEQVINFMKICVLDEAASDRIYSNNPTIEGSNDSTNGTDGSWDVLATVDDRIWTSPNKFPGYGALFIPLAPITYTSAIGAGIATSGQGDANLVFDGNTNTYINLAGAPNNWVQYEFSEPRTITRLAVRGHGTATGNRSEGATFYGSNTGGFTGEEACIGIAYQSAGLLDSWLYEYVREHNAQPYKFIRAILWPSYAGGCRLSEIDYSTSSRIYNTTAYRWYRLNGFTSHTDLRLSQWELYEGEGLETFDYSKVNIDGSDVRFRQIPPNQSEIYWQGGEPIDAMTEIPHMIDVWTTSGTSFIKTLPAEGTTEFYMYYGNPTAYTAETQSAFTTNYNFEDIEDLSAFNIAPETGDYIGLEAGAMRIQNNNDAWDCGVMANLVMMDRDAFVPNVSGTNPTFSYKVYATQTCNPRIGLYNDKNLFDRTNRDTEISLNKSTSDPEAYGFFLIDDNEVSSDRLYSYPAEYYTWYEVRMEILKSGTFISYRKEGDVAWTDLPYEHSFRANSRRLFPGALNYYSGRIIYLDDISIDLCYYDTSVLYPEEIYDPTVDGVTFVTIYNNTSNWTEGTVGYRYTPNDGVILPDILFNDISVTEGASKYSSSDNLIVLATTGGVIVLEERQNDEENSRFMYYLLE